MKKIDVIVGARPNFIKAFPVIKAFNSSNNLKLRLINTGQHYDFVVELMCTNPTKTVEDIDSCIDMLVKTNADSVIAVHKLEDHHPLRIKKIIDGRIVDFCLEEPLESRRQDLKPDAYIRSGSIYALKRDHLNR